MAKELTELNSSPLRGLNYSFESYLKTKKSEISKHTLGNGIMDYAYKSDIEYRKKLDSIPNLYKIAQTISSTLVPQELQKLNMNGLAVGPNQFPEVYQIACDCAKRLGMTVPNVYVAMTGEMNACAYACDDVEPLIMITDLMVKRATLGELRAVIGHECGHIQNNHVVYSQLSATLLSAGVNGLTIGAGALGLTTAMITALQQILTSGVMMTINMWSRAAEVTADRAGLICCDNVEDAFNLNKKFLYGGLDIEDKITTDIDLESLREQMELSLDNPNRLIELNYDHPLSIKRIFAEKEFTECDLFYKWRPDLKTPNQIMRSKEEADARCKKYIDVVAKRGGKK